VLVRVVNTLAFDGSEFAETGIDSDSGPNFWPATVGQHRHPRRANRRMWDARRRLSRHAVCNQQVILRASILLRTTPKGVRVRPEPTPEIAKLHKHEA